ncbi:Ribosomal protein PSRP-3/Ycf65 [Dillenia turbinata]|uniref:Ribosomal protein PSRP-3/Ycf65 n=1 Tax=Dillenia turbinata TaxID=194707 RepID=A0AAN8UDK9_9MAGN
MLSMVVQPKINGSFRLSTPPSKQLKSSKPAVLFKPKTSSVPSSLRISSRIRKSVQVSASALATATATAEAVIKDETSANDSMSPGQTEKLKVVVKQMEKPRLVLKFIWMEKNIGIALDQAIPRHGTIPLSPYYFWPRKDAWEELKVMLESRPWISQKQMIILLNQATDIINLWQQSGGDLQ